MQVSRNMVTLGIHGLGRVGRSILRRCSLERAFKVVAVNDLNPDIAGIAYNLNHDSVHGPPSGRFTARDSSLWVEDRKIAVLNELDISSRRWGELGVDVLIDASGGTENVARLREMVQAKALSWAFSTRFAPEADFVLTLGCNEADLRPARHRVISCNTCDATAIAPVILALDRTVGVDCVSLAILHPWLNHQNLLDSRPPEGGERDYELGRAAHDNIIPRKTSAEAAIRAVLPRGFENRTLSAISYRVPTPMVACADLSLGFRRSTSQEEIISHLRSFQEKLPWKLVGFNREPLVSSDFIGDDHAGVIEERLLTVDRGTRGRLALWYDNESGYAAQVLDQVRLCVTSASR